MLSHHSIDSAHGDPFLAWEALGGPARPNSEALATMRAQHEVPLLEPPRPVSPRGGAVDLPFTLPLPGVSLLRLTPRSIAPAAPGCAPSAIAASTAARTAAAVGPVAARRCHHPQVERADDAAGPWISSAAGILSAPSR